MDIHKIEILIRAIELGSLSKAAKEFLYTPSAVSHIFDTIENEIGIRFIKRGYSGIEVEDGCEEIVRNLKNIVSLEKRTKQIAYDRQNIFIVPLENIVWAYKYSYLNHFSLHKKISYSLCIVTDQKKRYTVHNKPKNGVDLVLNQLQTRFPEIMIGYKNENKHG